MNFIRCILSLVILLQILPNRISAQARYDSLHIKEPKHFFNTVIDLDGYRKPERTIRDTTKAINRKLKSYGIKQFTMTFYTPLVTKSWTGADGNFKNTHLMLTGTYMSLRPVFGGLRTHNLTKLGIGARYIFNTGKKGVWFADVSPFVTRDVSFTSKPYYRLASTFVYSHNSSEYFNWRLGITKSFLWGNRFYLPFVGIRIGRLDKVNLSIQFPRSASISLPVTPGIIFSFYTKPQGGMFNFSNADTLYFRNTEATFHFSRYELNTGFRADFRLARYLDIYIASGLSTRNNITFYSDRANQKKNSFYSTYFYRKDLPSTLYLNFGLMLKFGKTRSSYNVKNIYDAGDLNNVNSGNGHNVQIPMDPKRKSRANLESIQDLVDYNDF